MILLLGIGSLMMLPMIAGGVTVYYSLKHSGHHND
jgi:hypothetical protein